MRAEQHLAAGEAIGGGGGGANDQGGMDAAVGKNGARGRNNGGIGKSGRSPRWGAGLSEQAQMRLNYGRLRVQGFMTRYTHLQHVQVTRERER